MMDISQKKLAEDNIILVDKVIGAYPQYFGKNCRIERDDLKQIGYVGLCKAAMNFEPEREVVFPAYAKVVIRNEMLGAVIKTNRNNREVLTDFTEEDYALESQNFESDSELHTIISNARNNASKTIKKGIDAIFQFENEVPVTEIADKTGMTYGAVRTSMTRARHYLAGCIKEQGYI